MCFYCLLSSEIQLSDFQICHHFYISYHELSTCNPENSSSDIKGCHCLIVLLTNRFPWSKKTSFCVQRKAFLQLFRFIYLYVRGTVIRAILQLFRITTGWLFWIWRFHLQGFFSFWRIQSSDHWQCWNTMAESCDLTQHGDFFLSKLKGYE